jgi:hypothetical protein
MRLSIALATPAHFPRALVHLFGAVLLLALAGCGALREKEPPRPSNAEVQKQVVRLMPATVKDRQGWAADIATALEAQDIAPTTSNICAVLAVTEQESTFQADPPVPGLGRIARQEMDRRAARLHVPSFVVGAALQIDSPDGKSYAERLNAARTEKQLSAIFEDFIGIVPLGQQLFGTFNPVETGGPMQVSIHFAETHRRGYPYPVDGTIRQEVFSRRGGMYFGISHLLGYPAHYDRMLYRFADFNAGWYASRNAAFQNAVARATGVPLALDGDLVIHGSSTPGKTETAVRTLRNKLDMSDQAIRSALEQGEDEDFDESELYERVFELAEKKAGKPLPRAVLPGIALESPKITRKLTTAWFANRVDERYRRCLGKAGK